MVSALDDFRNSIQNIIIFADHANSNAVLAMRDSSIRNMFQTMQCAAVVAVSGYFESFIKEIVKTFIVSLNGKNVPFGNLPNKIKFAHFENGGAVLSKRASTEKKTCVTNGLEDLAQRLASVCAGNGYQLVWEAFTDTRSNPKPNVVKEIYANLDISDCWNKINPYCSGQGDSFRIRLESFVELRNECAHTGVAASPPTPEELKTSCNMLIDLASALYQLLNNHLENIAPDAAQSAQNAS